MSLNIALDLEAGMLQIVVSVNRECTCSCNTKRKRYEHAFYVQGVNIFEKNTFEDKRKGKEQECSVCSDKTNTFMDCCQKPVCKGCFIEWFGNNTKVTCPCCRDKITFK